MVSLFFSFFFSMYVFFLCVEHKHRQEKYLTQTHSASKCKWKLQLLYYIIHTFETFTTHNHMYSCEFISYLKIKYRKKIAIYSIFFFFLFRTCLPRKFIYLFVIERFKQTFFFFIQIIIILCCIFFFINNYFIKTKTYNIQYVFFSSCVVK